MRSITRDHFDVDQLPPVYEEETFECRFDVPRSASMRWYEAIRNQPFWRQSINATTTQRVLRISRQQRLV